MNAVTQAEFEEIKLILEKLYGRLEDAGEAKVRQVDTILFDAMSLCQRAQMTVRFLEEKK